MTDMTQQTNAQLTQTLTYNNPSGANTITCYATYTTGACGTSSTGGSVTIH